MKYLAALVLAITLITAVSCATGIKPPGPFAQTLLVLPVTETSEAQLRTHGFYYTYEIVNVDDSGESHQAIIKLPQAENMLIVDSLPPGNYAVKKFAFHPVGTGDFTYGENEEKRDDRFRLEAGKMTIFPLSLDVRLYNRIPGRGLSTSYEIAMNPLSQIQRKGILNRLKAFPFLQHWEISETEPFDPDLPLDAGRLRDLINGNTFLVISEKEGRTYTYHAADGVIYARASDGQENTGHWVINDDSQYCREWQNGSKRASNCFNVFAIEGNTYQMETAENGLRSIFLRRQGDSEGLAGESVTLSNRTLPVLDVTGNYVAAVSGNNWRLALALDAPITEVKLEQEGNDIKGSFGLE